MAEILLRYFSIDLLIFLLIFCAGKFDDEFFEFLEDINLGIVFVAGLLECFGEMLSFVVSCVFDNLVREDLVDLNL